MILFFFHPKSPNFYYKSVIFLLADCSVTPKIFIIFCKIRIRAQNAILVIHYKCSQNQRHRFKAKFYYPCEINDKNWIFGCLKYIIIFVNMQYYFAYIKRRIEISPHRFAAVRLSTTCRSPMRPRSFLARSNVYRVIDYSHVIVMLRV